jgi:hypothetical protein
MESIHVRPCGLLEMAVMAFQIVGVATLCLSRLLPASVWSRRGRLGFIVAMFGLATAGALCGRHDSEFALFAGSTMTLLLIGMTVGSSPAEMTGPPALPVGAESSAII